MIPVYQTVFSIPGGNCLQAALASVFEVPLGTVPHFANLDSDDWWQQCQEWCIKTFGVYPVFVPTDTKLEFIRGYHLMNVKTPSGSEHAVVGFNGDIVHDPGGMHRRRYDLTGYTLFISTLERAILP